VPRIVREAEIDWQGTTARGSGVVTALSTGSFELPSTIASRIAVEQGKTSPEELLAAAHGGCFTMSLAGELTGAGTPPERLDVHCTVTMDEVEDKGHLIVRSALDVHATVPGVEAPALEAAVEAADRECPFSTLLRDAGVPIDLTTTLKA
jgi:osmotically inducible protein OsmC